MRIREVGISGYRSLRAHPLSRRAAHGLCRRQRRRQDQPLQRRYNCCRRRRRARSHASSRPKAECNPRYGRASRKINKPARIKLSVGLGSDSTRTGQASFEYEVEAGVVHSYEIDVGVRAPTAAAFALEPQIKEETLVFRGSARPLTVLERKGPRATAIDDDGRKHALGTELLASETALGALRDPGRFGDIELVRRTMLDWRFYHDFRSDRDSPLRRPCLAVTTPTLASDGTDLAAVFATLVEIRQDASDLYQAIDDAFPGAELVVHPTDRTASFGLIQPDYPKRGIRSERAVGRNTALPGARRCVARLSPACIHRAERTRSQSASGPAGTVGTADRSRGGAHAGVGRDAFRAPR